MSRTVDDVMTERGWNRAPSDERLVLAAQILAAESLAALAKLELPGERVEAYAGQLARILDYIETLKSVPEGPSVGSSSAAQTRSLAEALRKTVRAEDVKFDDDVPMTNVAVGIKHVNGISSCSNAMQSARPPTRPSTMIPVHISGMAKPRWNCTIVKPSRTKCDGS